MQTAEADTGTLALSGSRLMLSNEGRSLARRTKAMRSMAARSPTVPISAAVTLTSFSLSRTLSQSDAASSERGVTKAPRCERG